MVLPRYNLKDLLQNRLLRLFATWPGLVGRDGKDGNDPVDLETMLKFISEARGPNGEKYDGVAMMFAAPHVDIDGGEEEGKRLARLLKKYGLKLGPVVPPAWAFAGGGFAVLAEDHEKIIAQWEKAIVIWKAVRDEGQTLENYPPVFRADSSTFVNDLRVEDRLAGLKASTARRNLVAVLQKLCDLMATIGGYVVIEPEVCWVELDTLEDSVEVCRLVARANIGIQGDGSHMLTEIMGISQRDDADADGYRSASALLPKGFAFDDDPALEKALESGASVIADFLFDWHHTQNDGTVHGDGEHDKTGRHVRPKHPGGKIKAEQFATRFLVTDDGQLRVSATCWDGCMGERSELLSQDLYDEVLAYMVESNTAVEELASQRVA